MKYQFIANHWQEFEITVMCRALKVSRSGYYAWRKRPLSGREMANQKLTQQIEEIHQDSRVVVAYTLNWPNRASAAVVNGWLA